MTSLAILGAGHWGGNLIRAFSQAAGSGLRLVADLDEKRLAKVRGSYPGVETTTDPASAIRRADVDAIVVATPAGDHFATAKAALEAGKHVLVEKPLALTSAECRDLIATAAARKRTLMVGHTFLYNAAVRKLRDLVASGEIGDVRYLYGSRLNLGTIRRDVDALWNFAPHDVSIAMYVLGAAPERVAARGFSYLQADVADVSFLTLFFPRGVVAQIHVSWLDPHKDRKMTVVGSKKMVVYDDVHPDAKIVIYDKGVDREVSEDVGSYGEFQLLLRSGDVSTPQIKFDEPLRVEAAHFLESIAQGTKPLTDGENGLHVVEILEAAHRSMRADGVPVPVSA